MPGMAEYCGRRAQVFKRVERMLVEPTCEVRNVKNTVLLEQAICPGRASVVIAPASISGEKSGSVESIRSPLNRDNLYCDRDGMGASTMLRRSNECRTVNDHRHSK